MGPGSQLRGTLVLCALFGGEAGLWGAFLHPLRAEAVPTEGGCPSGSSITVLVPDGSLGGGEAQSILRFSGPSEKLSLADGSGIMEKEGQQKCAY